MSEEKRQELLSDRVSIKPTPLSSRAQASLSVLVLPLVEYLYSCSHFYGYLRVQTHRVRSLLCAPFAFVRAHIR